jgi:hypothetical protein
LPGLARRRADNLPGQIPSWEHVLFAKLVSGGQSGVDRAALGVPCGGWCPRGCKAEDGAIPDRYLLTETPSGGLPPAHAAERAGFPTPFGGWVYRPAK